MNLELYNTCISVLQNFGVFFRPLLKLPNFVKFSRTFAGILKPVAIYNMEIGGLLPTARRRQKIRYFNMP